MKRVLWICLVLVLVGSVVVELPAIGREADYIWYYPAFFAAYGFVGCAVIVYVSKWIGKYWLQRDVDYYDPYRAPEPVRPAGGEGGEGGENV